MADKWHLISWNYGDVDDSEQQSIDSPHHSEYNAQSDCSEMDGFAERTFEVQFVPDAAVENFIVKNGWIHVNKTGDGGGEKVGEVGLVIIYEWSFINPLPPPIVIAQSLIAFLKGTLIKTNFNFFSRLSNYRIHISGVE